MGRGSAASGRAGAKHLNALWSDPERRTALLAKRQRIIDEASAANGGVRPLHWTSTGLTPRFGKGITRETNKRFIRQARFEATLLMKKLDKAGVFDDIADEDRKHAKEAMHAALEVMRNQIISHKDKLTAAGLVLKFTKSPPVQKHEVLNKAEDWLEAIANDAETDQGPTGGPQAPAE
jgi:hypothetical protein